MRRLRLATRIASREARRRPARSALVMFLVAMPVAGMTAATTILRTEVRTPLQTFEDEFGSGDIGFSSYLAPGAPFDRPDDVEGAFVGVDQVLAMAPEGTEIEVLRHRYQGIRTDTATAGVDIYSGDHVDVLGNRHHLVEGRTTRAGGEVAVSPGLSSRFGVGVGDRLVLERPSLELDVVGVVEDDRHLRAQALYFADEPPTALRDDVSPTDAKVVLDVPGTIEPARARELVAQRDAGALGYFEIRPTPEILEVLPHRYGATGQQETAVRWSIVAGALVLAAVGIVIAAAFTVGARQQLTTLGQLSANGAPEGLLRRVLMLQGTVTGLAGSIAGVAFAYSGVRLARGPMERVADHRMNDFVTRPSDIAVIVAVGVIGASIAALIPARSAARIPTLRALAGRRPEEPASRRAPVRGVIAFVVGLAVLAVATIGARDGMSGNVWAAVAIVGGLGVLFGATATTPTLVAALAPLAGRSRGVIRIAVRNLTRHRTRTGAVVAAVAAAGAIAIGGTTVSQASVDSYQAYTTVPPNVVTVVGYSPESGDYTAAPREVVARVARTLPDAERRQLAVARTPVVVEGPPDAGYGFTDTAVVEVDEAMADALRLSESVRDALQQEGIVIVRFADDEFVGASASVALGDREPVLAPLAFSRYSLGLGSGVYVSPGFASDAGLDLAAGPTVLSLPDGLTDIQRFDLEQVQEGLYRSPVLGTGGWGLNLPSDGEPISRRVVETILAAVATLLALIVLGIGLALAAADDREEATTLSVVGASPRIRSRATAAKAWIMATLGFLLAIPIGFLPVRVVRSTEEFATSTPFPVSTVAILVVLAPIVAAALTLAVSTVAGRLRPLRMSTAMFD